MYVVGLVAACLCLGCPVRLKINCTTYLYCLILELRQISHKFWVCQMSWMWSRWSGSFKPHLATTKSSSSICVFLVRAPTSCYYSGSGLYTYVMSSGAVPEDILETLGEHTYVYSSTFAKNVLSASNRENTYIICCNMHSSTRSSLSRSR